MPDGTIDDQEKEVTRREFLLLPARWVRSLRRSFEDSSDP